MTAARRSYRAALRHPVAGRLWAASTVSLIGDYIGQGALLVVAYERSGRRVVGPAALFAVTALPALISGAVGSAWLDRITRRQALVGAAMVGAVAIVLPVIVPRGLAVVYVAAAMLGAVRAATVAARSGALADAVPGEHRGPTIALLGTSEQASQVLGYLTGGAVALLIGAETALLVDAGSFLVAAAVVASIPFPPAEPRPAGPTLGEGLRVILSHPVLRLLAQVVWLSALVAALPETVAAHATGVGTATERWYPLVLAAAPAGQAITMLLVGRLPTLERPSVQLTHLVWLAVALGLAAFAPGPGWLVAGNLLVGSGIAWTIGPQLTFVQVAPPARMAQITGTMLATIIAAEGLGALALAWLADHTSWQAGYRVAGAVVLLAALWGWHTKERTPAARQLDEGQIAGPDSWTPYRPPSP